MAKGSMSEESLSTGTKLGLPELQLGILPGFGGTQRLPRLVGLQTAAQMMLTSAPINDKKAAKLGLVDAVVPADKLLPAARAWAAEIAAGTKPRNFTLYRCSLHLPTSRARVITFSLLLLIYRFPLLRGDIDIGVYAVGEL